MLEFLRSTAVHKVVGLSDEQAFAASSPPSTLTPAGVIKYLTGTERLWFSIDFADADVPWPWTDHNPHGNFQITPEDTLADIVASYQDECARSNRVVAEASLDDRARGRGWRSRCASRWLT